MPEAPQDIAGITVFMLSDVRSLAVALLERRRPNQRHQRYSP